MEIQVAGKTDKGRVRAQNEDAYLADAPLVAVADGMGGHEAGEVASATALEVIQGFKQRLERDGPDVLRDAVLEANRTVWSKGRGDQTLQGMGTTLTAAWLHEGTATLAHVGDSRAYLLRAGTLSQLTEDQTIVQQWEKEGMIGPGEAATHPRRHILLQAIGSDQDVNVDMTSVELRPRDRLLLSTDGLHGMLVDEDRIRDILLAYPDPEEACRVLVDAANEAGGEDNITVLLLDVVAEAAEDNNPGPVIVSKPTSSPRPKSRRVRPLYVILGVLTVVVLVAVGLLVTAQRQTQLVVGTSDGLVAILEGTPGRNGQAATGRPIKVYRDAPLERFPRHVQRDLRAGIPVGSQAEAERVVATLPQILGPEETPAPTPVPTPTPATPTPETEP